MTAPAELRREVRQFVAEVRDAGLFEPQVDGWFFGFSPEFTAAMAERGWIGMTWPRSYGGGGARPLERFVVVEELLAAGAPMNAHWVSDRQTGPSLLRFGTEAQRAAFLPSMARGECVTALGMSEPDAGSDLAAVSTAARRVDGGWSLTGQKVWTGNAHRADLIVVLARTDPDAPRDTALTQFLVRLPDPRVRATPIPTANGLRHFCRVELDEVFVPDDMVLGEVGAGWGQVVTELGDERGGPERYLSAFPLLDAFADELRAVPRPDLVRDLGILLSRLSALRALAIGLLGEQPAHGLPRAVRAAAFKAAATEAEEEIVELVRRAGTVSSRTKSLLDAAVAVAPASGLRGGTTEIMRGIVARGVLGWTPPASTASTSAAARMTDAMEWALVLAVEHTAERRQFGVPLRSFQAVQGLVARIATETLLSRAALDHADQTSAGTERGAASVADAALVQASVAAGRVSSAAHQALGARGFTEEHALPELSAAMRAERDEWAVGERLGRAVLAYESLWEGMIAELGWDAAPISTRVARE